MQTHESNSNFRNNYLFVYLSENKPQLSNCEGKDCQLYQRIVSEDFYETLRNMNKTERQEGNGMKESLVYRWKCSVRTVSDIEIEK